MPHALSALSAVDAAMRVAQGQPLDGGRLSLPSLINELIAKHSGVGWRFDNAVFSDCDAVVGLSHIKHPLQFSHCTFLDKIDFFRDLTFDEAFSLVDCTFDTELLLERCTFNKRCTFLSNLHHGEVSVRDCRFMWHPRIDTSHFRQGFVVNLQPLMGNGRQFWSFSECAFAGYVRIESPYQFEEVAFQVCAFAPLSFTEIVSQRRSVHLRLMGCELSGRLSLILSDGQPDPHHDQHTGATVDLKISTLSGRIDLRRIPLRWFNFEDAVVEDGTILFEQSGLLCSQYAGGWTLIPQATEDRCGTLLREQVARKLESAPSDWQGLDSTHHLSLLMREYDELYRASLNASGHAWQQDFCHYKRMEYQRLVNEAALEVGDFRSWSLAVGMAVVSGIASVTILPYELSVCALVFVVHVLWMWLVQRDRLSIARSLLDGLLLKPLLGYGVIVHRVIIGACAVIVAFACLFGALSYWQPSSGRVVYSVIYGGRDNEINALDEVIGWKQDTQGDYYPHCVKTSVSTQVRRMFYFSTVTFTTLGYGDYRPIGRAKYLAAIEACSGLIMGALVTVVFARRFLRL